LVIQGWFRVLGFGGEVLVLAGEMIGLGRAVAALDSEASGLGSEMLVLGSKVLGLGREVPGAASSGADSRLDGGACGSNSSRLAQEPLSTSLPGSRGSGAHAAQGVDVGEGPRYPGWGPRGGSDCTEREARTG